MLHQPVLLETSLLPLAQIPQLMLLLKPLPPQYLKWIENSPPQLSLELLKLPLENHDNLFLILAAVKISSNLSHMTVNSKLVAKMDKSKLGLLMVLIHVHSFKLTKK